MMIEALVAMRHEPDGLRADQFWQLVERFRADLVNQAVAILGNRPDAEDVAQDSLCRAFRCLAQLKDPQKLGTWLRTINRNNALQVLRNRRKGNGSGDLSQQDPQAPESTPTGTNLELAHRNRRIETIARAVDGLPEAFREVVVLRYWEGLQNQQIALRLGIAEGTVKSRLARADRHLHACFQRLWKKEDA